MNMTTNARFWIYHSQGDGYVKLTLRPGQELTIISGGPHEEGWSRNIETYWTDGSVVYLEWINEGRDCDGYLSTSGTARCHIGRLQAYHNPYSDRMMPEWIPIDQRQYDEFAVRAGY